jgi:uncharacterized protein DUF5680
MGSNETSRDTFVDFLLQAKRATYAGQGDEATVTPLVPGSKQLEYRDGDYLYRDIYLGMAYFVGQEVVSHRGQAVWSMSYAGGVMPASRDCVDPRAIYAFLRLALRHGSEAEPYRGPAKFSREALTYTNSSSGSLDAFWGVEEIVRDGVRVYECRYAGGVLR